MKKSKVGSGGVGSMQGTPKLNKHLMKVQPNRELTSRTADILPITDHIRGWPSMYDLAKSITKQK